MKLDTYVSQDGSTSVTAAKIIDVDIPRRLLTIILADNTTEVLEGLPEEHFFSPPSNPNVGDYFLLEGETASFALKEGFEGSMTLKAADASATTATN